MTFNEQILLRMAFVYAFNKCADFAENLMGDSATATTYRQYADLILSSAIPHYQSGLGHIYQGSERLEDGAVIHAIATFGEYLYGPTSAQAADTIGFLSKMFCELYPYVHDEVALNKPGVLIGRYVNDVYDGGNPWQLLTAVLAETFYLGASANYKNIEARGGVDYLLDMNNEDHKAWAKLLDLPAGSRISDLAARQVDAGDATMQRLHDVVQNDNGRLDEQIDKNAGYQRSAQHLTWSYANVLHAIYVRDGTVKLRERIMK